MPCSIFYQQSQWTCLEPRIRFQFTIHLQHVASIASWPATARYENETCASPFTIFHHWRRGSQKVQREISRMVGSAWRIRYASPYESNTRFLYPRPYRTRHSGEYAIQGNENAGYWMWWRLAFRGKKRQMDILPHGFQALTHIRTLVFGTIGRYRPRSWCFIQQHTNGYTSFSKGSSTLDWTRPAGIPKYHRRYMT